MEYVRGLPAYDVLKGGLISSFANGTLGGPEYSVLGCDGCSFANVLGMPE